MTNQKIYKYKTISHFMERKLEKKMKKLNYLSSNYKKLWKDSDKTLRENSRNNFNYENHKNDPVYKKIFEIKSENIDNFFNKEEENRYKRMIDLCDFSIGLLKRRKMNKETYEFFRDTPKEDFWLAIPDEYSFLENLINQL